MLDAKILDVQAFEQIIKVMINFLHTKIMQNT